MLTLRGSIMDFTSDRKGSYGRGGTSIAVALVLASTCAHAQELEEIVVSGYLGQDAVSASKIDMHVRDVPFTVANYSEELLQEIVATDTVDAYRYMTGVNRGGQQAHDLSMRGFKSTSNDRNAIMINGLPGPSSRFASPLASSIDHIEVVKGPASVLYGKAQPGGFVNTILKRPQAFARQEFTVRGNAYLSGNSESGDGTGYAAIADLTGPFDQEGRFLYRLVGEYNDGESFRDNVHGYNKFAMPSFTWNIAESTTLNVTGEYRKRRGRYDLGLVAPNRDIADLSGIPITTRYQEPEDFQTEEGNVVTLSLDHEFANGASVRFAGRRVRNHDITQWYDNTLVLGTAPNQTMMRRTARIGDNHRENDYLDASLTTVPFKLGFLGEHKFLIGVSSGTDSLDAFRKMFYTEPSFDINLFDPVHGAVPTFDELLAAGNTGNRQRTLTETDAVGLYLVDFIKLGERWQAVAGVRRDEEKQKRTNLLTSAVLDESDDKGTYPMAGIVFQPNDRWSLYGSYSTSFVPAPPNFQDASGGRSFKPDEGVQYEVGVKGFLLDDRLMVTLALFDIEKDNVLTVVPCNPGIGGTCHAEAGKEGSRGLELEVSAKLRHNWNVLAGYAYVDVEILEQAGTGPAVPLEGSREPHAIPHTFNLWTRYDFEQASLDGLSIGLGVIAASSRSGNFPTSANPLVVRIPSYWTADLALYYQIRDRWNMSLKVSNLFDEKYYDSIGSTFYERSIFPGAPRNISLSFTFGL